VALNNSIENNIFLAVTSMTSALEVFYRDSVYKFIRFTYLITYLRDLERP